MKLSLACYRFSFRVLEPIHFTDYAGSTLRGAFGHALMQLSGIRVEDIKDKTGRYKHSVYAAVFEPIAIDRAFSVAHGNPVPYVIKAPEKAESVFMVDDVFSFDMVLMQNASNHLSAIIIAWRRALLNRILNLKQPGKAELFLVEQHLGNGQLKELYSEQRPVLAPYSATLEIPEFKVAEDISLKFVTPLRLQHQGRVLSSNQLSESLLLRSLIRRFSLCFPESSPDSIEQLISLSNAVKGSKKLVPKDWQRYSNRQKRYIRLTGSVGHWDMKAVPVELLPYLWIGQYLHVGKNTSFGLGGYRIIN